MTRDEAIKIADRLGVDRVETTLDIFVALGMLKLDEPTDVQFDFLSDIAKRLPAHAVCVVNDTLAQRGLKIVEK